MTIQYTVPGFEPTTFGTRVSSHKLLIYLVSTFFNESIAQARSNESNFPKWSF